MIRIKGGMFRHVQAADFSSLHRGVAPGGPQDRFSCMVANQLLGNVSGAGAIEFTLAKSTVSFETSCLAIVAGAPTKLSLDGRAIPDWKVFFADRGSSLKIQIEPPGCRSYLCVAGGMDASMNFVGAAASMSPSSPVARDVVLPSGMFDWSPPLGVVRCLPGPEATEQALAALTDNPWLIDPNSSGMGLRLSGKTAVPLESFDIVSAPVQDGTIQATSSGLIALLRQRGTLGGYPRVATIIDCDVDRLAQFRPGGRIRFDLVDESTAMKYCQQQQSSIARAYNGTET